MKILLVDDEPDILETLRFRLAAGGYEVEVASNGAEALEKIRAQPFDLVVADFMMPELNGIELTRQIKDSPVWFNTKVILFSANPDPAYRKRAMEFGAEEYLPKTQGAAFLADKITEVLGAVQPVAATASNEGDEAQFRRELTSLSRSLVDLLRLAQTAGELSEPSRYAVESASRVAEDIRRLTESEA